MNIVHRSCLRIIFTAALVFGVLPTGGTAADAVNLTEGITPATAWPESATISTGDPSVNTYGIEINSATLLSQTFTPDSDMKLGSLYLAYKTSSASAPNAFTLKLQQVPEGNAAQTYIQRTNLFGSTPVTFSLASTGGAIRLLKFDFDGSYQVPLSAGTTYAIEISSSGSTLMLTRGSGSDTYSGGNLYSNRSAFNYPSTRDLAMAVVAASSITLTEGITLASDWPEPVEIDAGDPGVNTYGIQVNSGTMLSQSFTPASDMKLSSLYLAYKTSSASAPDSFTLKLQQVPGGSAAQTYTQGTNLFGSTPVTFSLASTGGATRLLKFDFEGAYRIPLSAGTTYAMEVSSSNSTLTLTRSSGSDTYSGGSLYSNRSAFNYPSTRDLAMAVRGQTIIPPGYQLTFSDEFNGPLDVSAYGPGTKWVSHKPSGGFGQATFADPQPGFPFTISNGILRIEAKKDASGQWWSGLLCSVDAQGNGFSQQYGYFEMRAKFPAGRGTWPAFWLLPTSRLQTPRPTGVEVDIVEEYGHNTSKLWTTLHWWYADGSHTSAEENTIVADMAAAYHTYSFLWNATDMIWYFDGVEVFRRPTPAEANSPMYILVDLAMGGGLGIDSTTPNPAYMYVDYVRAYSQP